MNKIRGDGYTMLYSEDLMYSAFGWDEFFDVKGGVQERLVNALARLAGGSKSKTRIWDTLLERGAQLFESSLDTHETKPLLIRKSLAIVTTGSLILSGAIKRRSHQVPC
jgi:hypothetical protein